MGTLTLTDNKNFNYLKSSSDNLSDMDNFINIAKEISQEKGHGVIAHDSTGYVIYINDKARKLTGIETDEILNNHYHGEIDNDMGKKIINNFLKTKKNMEINKPLKVSINGEQNNYIMATKIYNFKKNNEPLFIKSIDTLDEKRYVKNFYGIVGQNKKIKKIINQIKDVAQYDFPVHIFGETGTGKELVASAIHNESPRKNKPFLTINCGALPESLIESELFGHVKGSFSGAIRDKKGRFELADKGTIFLDEVAEFSKSMQVKLLRFLQDGTFEKVGGEKTVSVDVKIISATNKNLKEEVKKENFREDLYYRLNVVPIVLPALKERISDIKLLVNHFLATASKQYNKKNISISTNVLNLLGNYSWPGNIRELQNVIQYGFVKCKNGIIHKEDLPLEINTFVNQDSVIKNQITKGKLDLSTVETALEKTGGNKSKAAIYLGVGRATLYRFINSNSDHLNFCSV